jgi:hypothetical protein
MTAARSTKVIENATATISLALDKMASDLLETSALRAALRAAGSRPSDNLVHASESWKKPILGNTIRVIAKSIVADILSP